jgi:CBS domain-containing protein
MDAIACEEGMRTKEIIMLVRDVMSRDVQVTQPHSTLREATELMKVFNVGSLPVCEDGRVLGVVTDRDITVRAVAEGEDCWEGRVRDAMSMNIAYCFDDDDVAVAAQQMKDWQVRRLLALDRDKRLAGIVSLGDFAVHDAEGRTSAETLQGISRPNR